MKKVFGTMSIVPNIEIIGDTVYFRNNVQASEKMGLIGWEYEEYQISKDEFIKSIKSENTLLTAQSKVNADRADFLEELIVEMAMVVYP